MSTIAVKFGYDEANTYNFPSTGEINSITGNDFVTEYQNPKESINTLTNNYYYINGKSNISYTFIFTGDKDDIDDLSVYNSIDSGTEIYVEIKDNGNLIKKGMAYVEHTSRRIITSQESGVDALDELTVFVQFL
jgi:hypothetical protein